MCKARTDMNINTMAARGRSPVRPRPCFCNQPEWWKLLNSSLRRYEDNDLHEFRNRRVPSMRKHTLARVEAICERTGMRQCICRGYVCASRTLLRKPIPRLPWQTKSEHEDTENDSGTPFAVDLTFDKEWASPTHSCRAQPSSLQSHKLDN